MQIPDHVRDYVRQVIRQSKATRRVLSRDGSAVMALIVAGSLGFNCYVSENGEAFTEFYNIGDDSPPVPDMSPRGGIAALVLGSRTYPMLLEGLPARTRSEEHTSEL